MTHPEATETQVLTKESWRGLLLAGARRVIAHREHLDRINVFPVPDRDTGTNLALTMHAIIDALNRPQPTLAAVSSTAAISALTGAQGNSGVIFAQFFQGLREEISDPVQLTMHRFSQALRCAAVRAREALAHPREGTILTVISDVAEHLARHVDRLPGFRALLDEGLAIARRSLTQTTGRLAELRSAGVVDAGALGFVHFLEGLRDYFRADAASADLPDIDEEETMESQPFATPHFSYRYCTEAVVWGKGIDRRTIMSRLEDLGDSIVVAGNDEEIHAHVHTNVPAYALEMLAEVGTIATQKVDDMLDSIDLSAPALEREERSELALVTDSVCDLPVRFLTDHKVHMVPVRVVFNDTALLDRVDLTPRSFYEQLVTASELPKTSQPRPADFHRLYEYLAGTHNNILSIHLSADLSGTFQSAATAARQVSGETGVPIAVIDSRSASAAEGLVVWAAARAAESGLKASQCAAMAQFAAEQTRVYVYVPTVEYFVRGGRLKPWQGKIAHILRTLPILTSRDGKLVPVTAAIGRRAARRRALRLALRAARGAKRPMFVVSHSAALESAESVRRSIARNRPDAEVWITDTAPAIGSHSGPGGYAIAVTDAGAIEDRIRHEGTAS